MKPVRTPTTTTIFKLPGGDERNDLPLELGVTDDGSDVLTSTWELEDVERETLFTGGRIELTVWGSGHPPVLLRVVSS